MNRFDDQDFTKQIIDLELEGPEDDFPRCECWFARPTFISIYYTRLELIMNQT